MNKKMYGIYAITSVSVAILTAILRTVITLFFTESETCVYVRGSIFPQVFEYILAAICVVLMIFPCVKKRHFSRRTFSDNTKYTVFTTAVLGFMFLASSLLMILTMISQRPFDIFEVLLSVTGILSSIYYLSGIFSRGCYTEGPALLSMAPTAWSMIALIEVYFDMSILITSPNRAYNQLAFLAFAVFLLAETRKALKLENTLLYAPSAAIASILLLASSIPNLLCPHILSVGQTDRPIIYAVQLAAGIYAASRLWEFSFGGSNDVQSGKNQIV